MLRCSLQEMEASESADSADSGSQQQQYKYVLEPGTGTAGMWVPVAAGEDVTGQVKSMTQAEADVLNKKQ